MTLSPGTRVNVGGAGVSRRPVRSSTKAARSVRPRARRRRAQDRRGVNASRARPGRAPTRAAARDRASTRTSRPSSAWAAVAPRQTSTSGRRRRARLEPRPAGRDLTPARLLVDAPLAARLPLEVLDDDSSGRRRRLHDPRFGERLAEKAAGGADERPAREVLAIARLLADEHRAAPASGPRRTRSACPSSRAGRPCTLAPPP